MSESPDLLEALTQSIKRRIREVNETRDAAPAQPVEHARADEGER
jgi:hypothetical protein